MLVGIRTTQMVRWHPFSPEAATSVIRTCSEQQSFTEQVLFAVPVPGVALEDMVSPHCQGAQPRGR